MGGSAKKVIKKAAVYSAAPLVGVVKETKDAVERHKKSEAKEKQREEDYAVLSKEAKSASTASAAYEKSGEPHRRCPLQSPFARRRIRPRSGKCRQFRRSPQYRIPFDRSGYRPRRQSRSQGAAGTS